MTKKKVLIAGAGISGFLTYLYLDRRKYDVTLIERDERFRTVGYAIVMWNCGFNILQKTVLKNNPAYAEQFVRLERSFMLSDDTAPESFSALRNLGYIVDREDLLKIFIAEAQKIDGKMLTKTQIEDISQSGHRSNVTFNDGKTEEFDLILVCEGINSPTRNRFFKDIQIVDSEHAVEYVETKRLPALSRKNIIFTVNNFTGVIMTSRRSTVSAHFLLKNQPGYLEGRQKLRDVLGQTLMGKYGPGANLEYPTATEAFDLKDVYVKDFYTDNIVLLGDAAHGRAPVLGLGTTLATEDAFFLSDVLNALDSETWGQKIDAVLNEYSTERRKRSEKLYALQDLVARTSLPKKLPNREQEHGRAFKIALNFIYAMRSVAFDFIFGKTIRYDIGKDVKQSLIRIDRRTLNPR